MKNKSLRRTGERSYRGRRRRRGRGEGKGK